MTRNLLPGISARTVPSSRLRANVLERGPAASDRTIVFVHGNVSSSLFWQPLMLALPDDIHSIAVDLRGFGGSESLPVDATRGVRDFADDVWAVIDTIAGEPGPDAIHLVGWSMGGPIVLQQLLDRPEQVASLTLVAPVSPYGLGGTDGVSGRRVTDDDAGCGGATASAGFVSHLVEGDRTADHRSSPRTAFRASYVAPGFRSEYEDIWVESILSTKVGDRNYPGDSVPSPHWPGFAAGTSGPLNAMAPRYLDVSGIDRLRCKPPILWARGLQDVIISDSSIFDTNALGLMGRISGWPGSEIAPPQPMPAQIRNMLDRYSVAGGTYRELGFENCGHSPHIERTAELASALDAHTAGRVPTD
jgi:pimeloyl-ACP methyl ester carboxylesterase